MNVETFCDVCQKTVSIPDWITNAGGMNYPNAPERQKLAIHRAHQPVLTVEEQDIKRRRQVNGTPTKKRRRDK